MTQTTNTATDVRGEYPILQVTVANMLVRTPGQFSTHVSMIKPSEVPPYNFSMYHGHDQLFL